MIVFVFVFVFSNQAALRELQLSLLIVGALSKPVDRPSCKLPSLALLQKTDKDRNLDLNCTLPNKKVFRNRRKLNQIILQISSDNFKSINVSKACKAQSMLV